MRCKKNIILSLVVVLLIFGFVQFVSASSVTSFYGYAMNASNKTQPLENVNVTFTIYESQIGENVVNYYENQTDENGWFNITGINYNNSNYAFGVNLRKYNESNKVRIDLIGPTIPLLQQGFLNGSAPRGENLQNTSFYLRKGALINITTTNEIVDHEFFSFYQIKDKKLSFSFLNVFNPIMQNNFTAYVPAERNYTVMIAPNGTLPISIDVTSADLEDGYYNYTFNTTENSEVRLTGYVNTTEGANFSDFYVLVYLMLPGRKVFLGDQGGSPFLNITSGNDHYNLTTGFYNISTIGIAENAEALVMPVAFNRSGDNKYYSGFKSVNLEYDIPNPSEINFTLQEMRGNLSDIRNLTVDTFGNAPGDNEGGFGNVSLPLFNINILNSQNILVSDAGIEIQLDYGSLNLTNFTFISDGSTISVPLLDGIGIKRINVFTPTSAPFKTTLSDSTLSSYDSEYNLTLKSLMSATDINGQALENMYLDMIELKDTCFVPNYDASDCSYFGGQQEIAGDTPFDPFTVVMSGAKMSFVMRNANNITVMYKNVDMIASGPPDIAFDTSSNNTDTETSFAQAWKFGSSGPEIYDEVIIGIPYTRGSSSQTGFNDSAPINLTINNLYGGNFESIWNSDDNNISDINDADINSELYNFKDYLGTEYESYLNESYPQCNESDNNLTSGLCYLDKENQVIWFKIPHFSAVGASPTGAVITEETVEEETDDEDDSSSSSSGGSSSSRQPQKRYTWSDITPGVANVMKDFDAEIGVKEISIKVKNAAQNVRITVTKQDGKPADVSVEKSGNVYQYLQIETENLDDNLESAVVNFKVEKDWMDENGLEKENIAVFKFGEEKWDELVTEYVEDDDDFYYFDVELTSFSYFAISEKEIVEEETTEETKETEQVEETEEIIEVEEPVEERKSYLWLWIVLILLIISVASVVVYMKFYKK